MSALRPSVSAALARASSSKALVAGNRFRFFSTTARRQGGGGMQYDPPTGWLWGVRPGEKYQNEGWEGPFFYGFWGSIIVFAIAYAWKPDTRYVFSFPFFFSHLGVGWGEGRAGEGRGEGFGLGEEGARSGKVDG